MPLSENRQREARPITGGEGCPPCCWVTRGLSHEAKVASPTEQNDGTIMQHRAHGTAGSQQASTHTSPPANTIEDVMRDDTPRGFAVTAVQGQGACQTLPGGRVIR